MKLSKFDTLCENIMAGTTNNNHYFTASELEDELFKVIDEFVKSHNIDPSESADTTTLLKNTFDKVLKSYEIKFPALNKNTKDIDELKSDIEVPANYFEKYVQPIYDALKLSIEAREDKDDAERTFVEHYDLTNGDKDSIVEYIKDECTRWSKKDVEKSIFDQDIIKEMVMTWITDNFDIMF